MNQPHNPESRSGHRVACRLLFRSPLQPAKSHACLSSQSTTSKDLPSSCCPQLQMRSSALFWPAHLCPVLRLLSLCRLLQVKSLRSVLQYLCPRLRLLWDLCQWVSLRRLCLSLRLLLRVRWRWLGGLRLWCLRFSIEVGQFIVVPYALRDLWQPLCLRCLCRRARARVLSFMLLQVLWQLWWLRCGAKQHAARLKKISPIALRLSILDIAGLASVACAHCMATCRCGQQCPGPSCSTDVMTTRKSPIYVPRPSGVMTKKQPCAVSGRHRACLSLPDRFLSVLSKTFGSLPEPKPLAVLGC